MEGASLALIYQKGILNKRNATHVEIPFSWFLVFLEVTSPLPLSWKKAKNKHFLTEKIKCTIQYTSGVRFGDHRSKTLLRKKSMKSRPPNGSLHEQNGRKRRCFCMSKRPNPKGSRPRPLKTARTTTRRVAGVSSTIEHQILAVKAFSLDMPFQCEWIYIFIIIVRVLLPFKINGKIFFQDSIVFVFFSILLISMYVVSIYLSCACACALQNNC